MVGFPADSHETVFLTLNGKHPYDRCPECGNVFKYTQYQEEHHDEAEGSH
jgi:cytochrome c oxidase subunit 5b